MYFLIFKFQLRGDYKFILFSILCRCLMSANKTDEFSL